MNTPQKDVFEYSIKSIVDGKVIRLSFLITSLTPHYYIFL